MRVICIPMLPKTQPKDPLKVKGTKSLKVESTINPEVTTNNENQSTERQTSLELKSITTKKVESTIHPELTTNDKKQSTERQTSLQLKSITTKKIEFYSSVMFSLSFAGGITCIFIPALGLAGTCLLGIALLMILTKKLQLAISASNICKDPNKSQFISLVKIIKNIFTKIKTIR